MIHTTTCRDKTRMLLCASAAAWFACCAASRADASHSGHEQRSSPPAVGDATPLQAATAYLYRWGFFALMSYRESLQAGDGVAMLMRELQWSQELARRVRDYVHDANKRADRVTRAETVRLCDARGHIRSRARLASALVAHDEAVQRTRRELAQNLAQVLDPSQERRLDEWIEQRLRRSFFIESVDYSAVVEAEAVDPDSVLQSLCGKQPDSESRGVK